MRDQAKYQKFNISTGWGFFLFVVVVAVAVANVVDDEYVAIDAAV